MQRDSVSNTIIVAVSLCVVCSVLVSAAAVGLRKRQEANKEFDQQKNVLLAAGLIDSNNASRATIDEVFANRIERALIDLETKQPVDETEVDFDISTFDQRAAANSESLGVAISPEQDVAGISRRSKYAFVYKVQGDNGELEKIVLPIRGKCLWSTL
ncbi:MAG: hypothetical protein AAF961_19230 [Planctomycetota bacterium]